MATRLWHRRLPHRALEHIRQPEVKSPADEQRLQDSIRGVEKKPLPHLLCVTNMLLHGIEVPVNVATGEYSQMIKK